MSNNAPVQLKLDDFENSEKIDWLDHPKFGVLDPGILLDNAIRKYEFNLGGKTQNISVDISQNNGVSLDKCAENFFEANFPEGDPVLLADNTTSTPIIVTFDPPVRAVGTHISSDGLIGEVFSGFQYLRFSEENTTDHQWEDPLFVRGKISKNRNTAPFIGAQAPNGKTISAVAFDVSSVASPIAQHVAINTLRYIPQ